MYTQHRFQVIIDVNHFKDIILDEEIEYKETNPDNPKNYISYLFPKGFSIKSKFDLFNHHYKFK